MERKFRVTVNGTQYDVTVEELSEGSGRLLPQPGDMRIPTPQPQTTPQTSAPPAASGDGGLPSPLAGVVHAVEVAAGDRVEKGQTVVIIESMKMKATVVADRSGTVAKVLVEPGQAVDAGQALLSIE